MQIGATVALVNGERIPVEIDTRLAHTWHVPKNEREYLRSPQKSLWRTAKELKMEHYRAIDMFDLIEIEEVPAGYEIFHTLWAHAMKFEDSVFKKLNPRWCLQGGSMDRELYR